MGYSIFVVDDSQTIRFSLGEILEGGGHEVKSASNGLEALNSLHKLSDNKWLPHLIITDINMETMNGIEFIKKAKKTTNLSSIPILIMTTESEKEKKMEGRAAGAIGWLVKPFNPEQILGIVEKVLNRR